MEDYAVDNSTKSTEPVPSLYSDSNLNLETDAKALTIEPKKSKNSDSAGGSEARKRTKPEGHTLEAGSEIIDAIDDNLDWFDDIADDDIITDGLLGDVTNCNDGQSRSDSSALTEPSAKRYRR